MHDERSRFESEAIHQLFERRSMGKGNAFENEFADLFGTHPLEGVDPEVAEEITRKLNEADDPNKTIEPDIVINSLETAQKGVQGVIESVINGAIAVNPGLEQDTFGMLTFAFFAGLDLGRIDADWALKLRRKFLSEEDLAFSDRAVRLIFRHFPMGD